ncbi:DUF503 domain-containing protein [Geochorda subterranea]|uniref:DUF503 domain-containing protein n=1 Tax=Geochorda subterranea TaxID=3109564 RepID=A0ABZ1BKA5_9FIRM|nr:DUF503 domain-containing protein [Limnochorda sp. LNt]WRP13300.1 DUF503 domain-containing protein [Limnochorda sp. LNt]
MVVAVATADIWIEGSQSLKDRRRVVRALVDRLRARLNVSVVEMDQPSTWQRARVVVACVAQTEAQARAVMEQARRLVERDDQAQVTRFEISFYC